MRPFIPYALIAACSVLFLTATACTTEEVGPSQRETEAQPDEESFEPDRAPALLGEMSLEEKIGQLLVRPAQGASAEDDTPMIETGSPGGIIYCGANLQGTEQIAQLSAGVQELAAETGQGVPLFI